MATRPSPAEYRIVIDGQYKVVVDLDAYKGLATDHERELAERDRRIAELEQGLRWACDQLIYYLPKPMDTEASRVFDEARALLERVRKEDSCQN